MTRIRLLAETTVSGVTYPIDKIIVVDDDTALTLIEQNKATDIIGIQVTTGGSGITTGTEYDTGQRIDGAIVYGKIINFGALPNNTTKNVAHGISGLTLSKVVSMFGSAYSSTAVILLPLISTSAFNLQATIQASDTNLTITTATDRSAFTAPRIFITYLK